MTSSLWAEVGQTIAPAMPAVADPLSPLQQRRRRGFDSATDDGREAVELVREDGVLRWVWRAPQQQARHGRRAWRSLGVDARDVVQRFEYPPLGKNQVTSALAGLDVQLNPSRGLRRWKGDAWQPLIPGELAQLQGRVLLLVHGTFSRSEMYDTELRYTPQGRRFFDRVTGAAPQPYSAVLAFDHATLSIAPWLNALDLIQELAPLKARLDVVCHSRGGLVTCWALKIAPLNVDQVVFVGSPLAGTSLASPDRLREALDMLANVADALSTVSRGAGLAFPPAMPLAMGAAGLARVLGKGLSLGAATPLADAAVGLVPGLMSQSRVLNNLELERLFPLPTKARLSGIGVVFKPDEVKEPIWKFWNRFSNVVDQAKYYGAELIFRQPNDLVVDTNSMNQLGTLERITNGNWKFLGEASHTHHCSYFRNTDAIAFLENRLQ